MQAVSTVGSLNSLQSSYQSSKSKSCSSHTSTTTATTDSSSLLDTFTNSGATPADTSSVDPTTSGTSKSALIEGFNLDDFNKKIRDELLSQIKVSKDALKNSGVDIKWASDILYPVDESVQATDVPTEWNADNTSQRIVDFALQFRDAAKQQGLSDEEFMAQIKDAVKQGFSLAKGDLGDLPEGSAKLFNDTYKATMDKLDKVLASWQDSSTAADTTTSAAISSFTASNSTQQASFSLTA